MLSGTLLFFVFSNKSH